MAASSNDLLRKASNGAGRPVVTSLALPKSNGATEAELTSSTNWNTTTGVDVIIYRRQLNSTTGQYEAVEGTQTDWVGELTGSTLSNLDLRAGTEPASGYAADGNTVVLAGPTAAWSDDLYNWGIAHANQDGSLKSAAVRTALGIGSESSTGWDLLGNTPNSITYNGNGSYTCVFNGVDLTGTISPGMRLRTTRTVAAPTQSTSLNGTSQYWSNSSPSGMTFTDDFVVSAWIKMAAYGSADQTIISRYNGTSGFYFDIVASGQLRLVGANAGAGNFNFVQSYQSIPLNKWVHVTAQLDMSTAGTSTTTSYIMIDGVDIPASKTTGGTAPTALIQAGNLEIGSRNGGTLPAAIKIAQVAIYSAKIPQANVRTLISQGLTPALISSNNIVSAHSFDGNANDLNTTNANNLTANGSAVATNADSPFGTQASGLISSTLDYGIVQSVSFSTNTTLTVQVPEGCTIPTSGGVSAVAYSSQDSPYGFPKQRNKWVVEQLQNANASQNTPTGGTWYNIGKAQITIPIGSWEVEYRVAAGMARASGGTYDYSVGLSTANNTPGDLRYLSHLYDDAASANLVNGATAQDYEDLSSATTLYLNGKTAVASSVNNINFENSQTQQQIRAINALL